MRTPTPRNSLRARGFGTLIGNGWLREPPRAQEPRWDLLRGGKSAMRKCMFLPVPEEIRASFPVVSASALPPAPVYRPQPAQESVPHRRDPRKDVRSIPAVDPREVVYAQRAQQHQQEINRLRYEQARDQARYEAKTPKAPPAWWEDPVALGSLLILVPPIGLAAVWSSKRYSNDARWALTVMTALTMCLMCAIVLAVLVMR